MNKKLAILGAALVMGFGTAAAQKNVTGHVVDKDGEPVIGAAILIGDKAVTVTDANGDFKLSDVPSGSKKLTVSYIGMETATVSISSNMNIVLQEEDTDLGEVMVVAFGTAKKSAFTGSAKVVGSEELGMSQVSSATNALAGAVAGVQLTSSNGAPGSTSTIRIRGFSSISDNVGKDPLIIVDGAPYEGDIANLNPNDIESMTVLKDAASNALYGARGSNGVIMITTKKAKNGEATITFDGKMGVNSSALQHYSTISSPAQYYEMQYGALKDYYLNNGYSATEAWQLANQNLCGDQGNGGLGYNVYTVPEGQYMIGINGKLNPAATLGRVVSYKGQSYLLTPDDWENLGTRNGMRQEYNLSASAATDRSNFYLSLGYLKNEGITEKSDMERFSARLKADYQLKKWAKVGANMSYAHFDYNQLSNNGSSTSTGNIWAFTSQMAPIYPVWIRNADGSIKVDSNGLEMMDYGNATYTGCARPFISDANPIMDNKLNTNYSEGNAMTANGFIDITFCEGLVLTVNGTMNLDETRQTYVYNPYYGQFDTTGGTVYKYHSRSIDYNLQQLLNYTKSFGNNNFNIMLGHEYTNEFYYLLGANKTKMFSQDNKELDGAVVDGQGATSYKTRYNNEGYFARLQYDFDGKYYASGSIRRDASSRFDKDYRWGTFWSVGGAWIVSKENWYKAQDWLDMLKVKASVGSQGNDNIGSYRYTDLYTITNSAGNVGTSFDTKGTKDITWETKTNWNAGLEFSLFKRLTGSVEYFYGKTTNMLFSFTVAPSLGYTSYFDNVGNLYNSGWEVDLNANLVNLRNFKWDFNVNFTQLKNRITKLHDDKKTSTFYDLDGNAYPGYTSGSFYIAEDISMYTWRLKEYAGVYSEKTWQMTEDTEYDASKAGLSMWYKNTFVKDADGNDTDQWNGTTCTTTYSDASYYVSRKSTIPKFYGGFGTKFEFFGIDISANFSYQLGGKAYDSTYATFMASPTASNTGYNFHEDLLKSWSAENADSNIPRFQFADSYSVSSSTRFLTNASYLNIENVNVGYTFPERLTKKAQISRLRIYAAAENLWYISARKGFDPRQSYNESSTATNYSPMRTISGGLTVTF